MRSSEKDIDKFMLFENRYDLPFSTNPNAIKVQHDYCGEFIVTIKKFPHSSEANKPKIFNI